MYVFNLSVSTSVQFNSIGQLVIIIFQLYIYNQYPSILENVKTSVYRNMMDVKLRLNITTITYHCCNSVVLTV